MLVRTWSVPHSDLYNWNRAASSLSLGPVFSVEEMKAHRRKSDSERSHPASSQAGARTGLWILLEVSFTTPLLLSQSGVGR